MIKILLKRKKNDPKMQWGGSQIGWEARLAGKPDWLVNKSKPKKLINLGNCRKTIHEEKKAG